MRFATIAAAAAAALISTVGMAAEPAQTFTHQGHTYIYKTSARANGKTVIEGYEQGSHAKFRLVVNGDRVTGVTNGYPVAFRTSQAVGTTQVAAN